MEVRFLPPQCYPSDADPNICSCRDDRGSPKTSCGTRWRSPRCYSEVLRRLGLGTSGGNPRTIQKYVGSWDISVEHFDPDGVRASGIRREPIPLAAVLVQSSTYHRGYLKERLYHEGLKDRACELCGQGETWNGAPMSLILDHVNG